MDSESESRSVVSDSLRRRGLYSPWNSPGQNTGVGSLSLLQGIFPAQVSRIAGGFFTSWASGEAQEYWSGSPIPSPADLSHPGIEPGSPALQVDSLPIELSGKPLQWILEENASGRRKGKDHFEMCQRLLFFSTRSALRRSCLPRAWPTWGKGRANSRPL